jgi:hypothetical protein
MSVGRGRDLPQCESHASEACAGAALPAVVNSDCPSSSRRPGDTGREIEDSMPMLRLGVQVQRVCMGGGLLEAGSRGDTAASSCHRAGVRRQAAAPRHGVLRRKQRQLEDHWHIVESLRRSRMLWDQRLCDAQLRRYYHCNVLDSQRHDNITALAITGMPSSHTSAASAPCSPSRRTASGGDSVGAAGSQC